MYERTSLSKVLRSITSLLSMLREERPFFVDPSGLFYEKYVDDVEKILCRLINARPVRLLGLARFSIDDESFNCLINHVENSLKTFYNGYDLVIAGEPVIELAIVRNEYNMVKLGKSLLNIVLTVPIKLKYLLIIAKAGTLFIGSGYPRLIPLYRYRFDPPLNIFLEVSISLKFIGAVKARRRIMLKEVTDVEIAEAIREIFRGGEPKLNGEVLRKVSDFIYCTSDGLCLQLEELPGKYGHTVIKPVLYYKANGVVYTRPVKYVIIRNLNGRVIEHDKYIIIS